MSFFFVLAIPSNPFLNVLLSEQRVCIATVTFPRCRKHTTSRPSSGFRCSEDGVYVFFRFCHYFYFYVEEKFQLLALKQESEMILSNQMAM